MAIFEKNKVGLNGDLETIVQMFVALMEAKDVYTVDHSQHVAKLAREIAGKMSLDEQETRRIYLAGLLHDIGKMAVSDRILQKPGKLTRNEYEEIKMHPEIGCRILETAGNLFDSVATMVRYHHERWDGSGYPAGLKGEQIPLGAAILAVADAYDAMVSNRPYRLVRVEAEVLAEIKGCSGSQFNPQVAKVFLDNYRGIKSNAEVQPFTQKIFRRW